MDCTTRIHVFIALTLFTLIRSCYAAWANNKFNFIKRPQVDLDSYRKMYLRLRIPTKQGRTWKDTDVPKSPEIIGRFSELCGVPTLEAEKSIFHGSNAPERSWPWQVLVKGVLKLCSGVLISDRWVLTVGHCFNKTEKLVIGRTDLDKWTHGSEERTAALELVHKNYDVRSKDSDIGLIMLDKAVHFNDFIRPICILKTSPKNFIYPDDCYVTGWGMRNPVDKHLHKRLQQLKVRIMPHSYCRLLWSLKGVVIHSGHVCLEFNTTVQSAGVCSGDSGGPLSCKINGKFFLFGLGSFVEKGCMRSYLPDVFTRVFDYLDWINQTMTKYSSRDSVDKW